MLCSPLAQRTSSDYGVLGGLLIDKDCIKWFLKIFSTDIFLVALTMLISHSGSKTALHLPYRHFSVIELPKNTWNNHWNNIQLLNIWSASIWFLHPRWSTELLSCLWLSLYFFRPSQVKLCPIVGPQSTVQVPCSFWWVENCEECSVRRPGKCTLWFWIVPVCFRSCF